MQRNNLIINYLPPSFRDQELKKLFQQYGNIVHSKVICSKNTAESLTYGFVMFENEEDANKALNDVNGLSVCGKQLKVSIARPRNFGGKGCKLHVSRLPVHYTWDMVHNLFSQFGEIIELRLLVNQDGNSRQVAFIQYSNREESDAALSAMNGYVPSGGENGLAIKYATNHKTSKFQENEYDEFTFDSHSITSSSNFIHQPNFDPNINYQNSSTINPIPWNISQSYHETPSYQYQQPWVNNMITLPPSNHPTQQLIPTSTNNHQTRNRIDKIPPMYHHHSNLPQPHPHHSHHPHHQHPHPHQQPYITSNMWPTSESEYIQNYIQPSFPMTTAASAPNPYQNPPKLTQSIDNMNQLPINNISTTTTTSSSQSSLSSTTTSTPTAAGGVVAAVSKLPHSLSSSSSLSSKDNRPRRNLIQQSSSTSSDSSTVSASYYQNPQYIYPNHSVSSRTPTPTPPPNFQSGQEYIITIKDISSSHDILSFTFLSSFGRIIEGKLLHILSQDNNSTIISVQFILLPHTIATFTQLQQLHNSAILLDGISMMVVLEQKTS